jgi:hypothetical protein
MGDAGGKARVGETPGLTLFKRDDKVVWANASESLRNPSPSQWQLRRIQAAIEKEFPGKTVTHTTSISDAIEKVRAAN